MDCCLKEGMDNKDKDNKMIDTQIKCVFRNVLMLLGFSLTDPKADKEAN